MGVCLLVLPSLFQAYLREHGIIPPSRATFYNILKKMPAANTRIMKGINPSKVKNTIVLSQKVAISTIGYVF